jgi:hypothetical protein
MTYKYLDSKRISGLSTDVPAISGGWKELDRTTLGSAGDTITVSNLPNKPYYMVLGSTSNGSGGSTQQSLRFNGDGGGTQYGRRHSMDGASEVANMTSRIPTGSATGTDSHAYTVSYIANKSDKEKLVISHGVDTVNHATQINAPSRSECVGKWINVTDPISSISIFNPTSGDFQSGSECVVLGYDPEDTHTTNFWEQLADVSWSSGSNISTGTFTPKKYLWVQGWITKPASQGYISMRVGYNTRDDGTNYKLRYQMNGATDGVYPNNTTSYTNEGLWMDAGNSTNTRMIFANYCIVNIANKQKIIMGNNVYTSALGASAPNRIKMNGKWNNTSNQINIIDFHGINTGNFTGGQIKVWGSD